MNLVNKNLDNTDGLQNKLGKLASYSALAGAFLSLSPDAEAQCGFVDLNNPVLDVDVNDDGIADFQINFNSFTFSGSGSFSTAFGPYQFSNISYFAPISNGPISIYQTFGSFCSLFYYSSLPINIPGVQTSYFKSYSNYVRSSSFVYALGYAFGANQLIGLGSSSSVCFNAYYGGSFTFISGQSYQKSYAIRSFSTYQKYNIPPYGPATVTQTFAWPSCLYYGYNSTLNTFTTRTVPAGSAQAMAYINYPGNYASTGFSYGPVTFSNTFINQAETTFVGVQFQDANGESFNGWVEFVWDEDTRTITCVDKAFNPCSIESVNAVNGTNEQCPVESNIEVGEQFVGVCPSTPIDDCKPSVPAIIPNAKRINKSIKQAKGQRN